MPRSATHQALTEIDIQFLLCRPGGPRHAWDPINPPEISRKARVAQRAARLGTRESFRCTRCGMRRHEIWSKSGKRIWGPKYERPEGFAPLPRSVTADMIRKELLQRWANNSPMKKRR